MISRIVLCIQYSTVIWHIRHYHKGRIPLALAIGVHFAAAMIYLGIGFRFEEGRNSRVYVVWYILAACEALIQLGLAWYCKVLTFTGTHLTERMTVVTVVILGSGGVTNIAKNVMLIVSNDSGWSKSLFTLCGIPPGYQR
jgi:low temperature requirement protein LtrA